MKHFFTQSKLNSYLNLTKHSIIVKNTNLFYFSASTDFFQPIGIGYKLHVNIVIKMIEKYFNNRNGMYCLPQSSSS